MEITIGQLIKDYRKTNKIKAVTLAKGVGVTYQHIWNIETDKSTPSLELLFKILDLLNIKASDFFKKYELLKYLNEKLELSIYVEKKEPLVYSFLRKEGRELKNILIIQGDSLAYTDFISEEDNINKNTNVLLRCSIYSDKGLKQLKEYLE